MSRRKQLIDELESILNPVKSEHFIQYKGKFFRPGDFDGISKPKRGAQGIPWASVGLKRLPPFFQFENCRIYFF